MEMEATGEGGIEGRPREREESMAVVAMVAGGRRRRGKMGRPIRACAPMRKCAAPPRGRPGRSTGLPEKKRVTMLEGGRCIGGGQPLRSAIRFKSAFSW
jgi:hypothetical protein